MPDDGHAIKLARAAGICQEVTKKYQDRDWVLIKGDDTWAKINHLILDSLQSPGEYWVRSAGLDEAWTVSLPRLSSSRPFPGQCLLTQNNQEIPSTHKL